MDGDEFWSVETFGAKYTTIFFPPGQFQGRTMCDANTHKQCDIYRCKNTTKASVSLPRTKIKMERSIKQCRQVCHTGQNNIIDINSNGNNDNKKTISIFFHE